MLEFEQFIEDIIDKRGINENDKLELKYEISSHLLLLKNEYLEKGYDEKTSVKLAIDSFGNSNLIGNALKASLPSKINMTNLPLRI
ncbi:permease prefix domain 1-containing protein [Clostridium botulinum]|nr:permease prefix domain 1-containing protein [Clostridium botulinum]MCS4479359.1 permease prefix domain 1-containing protein [Clostridium botulinum]